MTLYILKVQGTKKNSDHIQIRDEDFNLIAYFPITSPKRALTLCHLVDNMKEVLHIASTLTYGKIEKVEL
jgi:hypothetical protein